MSHRRHYSDHDRLYALQLLEENGDNVRLTARQLGIPVATLHQWATGARRSRSPDMVDGPLTSLWQFRFRAGVKVDDGAPIKIDPGKLSRANYCELFRLLKLASFDSTTI